MGGKNIKITMNFVSRTQLINLEYELCQPTLATRVMCTQIFRFLCRAYTPFNLGAIFSHLLRRHDSSKADSPPDNCHLPCELSYSAHIYVNRQDLCS